MMVESVRKLLAQGWVRYASAGTLCGACFVIFFYATEILRGLPLPKSLSPFAFAVNLSGALAFMLFVILLLGGPLICLGMLSTQATRKYFPLTVAFWIVVCLGLLTGPYCERIIEPVKQAGRLRVVKRAQPLITAIERYHTETGSYPDSLGALMPKYINEIPYTGLAAHPEYRYSLPTKYDSFAGYKLRVSLRFLLDFDELAYYPSAEDREKKLRSSSFKPLEDGWVFFND